MTSQKQIEANRRNAAKSTGPRTQEGKAAVSGNAIRHGILAKNHLLSDENGEQFADFASRVAAEMAPASATEAMIVERIISSMWRLRRVVRMETESLSHEMNRPEKARLPGLPEFLQEKRDDSTSLGRAFIALCESNIPALLTRYESAIHRGMLRDMELLRQVRGERLAKAARERAKDDLSEF